MDIYVSIAKELLKNADTRLVCIDVGSAGGFHPRLESIRSDVDIIGFEADSEECARLNAGARYGERHINAAIGRENEKVVLELHNKRKTSSCYKTDMGRVNHFYDAGRFAPDGEICFSTRSLDAVRASEGISRIDYVKIDVEGHELAVLEGCTGAFLLAEIEVYFHPFRKGACFFDQIMHHMRERGFILLDLRRTYWSSKRVSEIRNYGAKGFPMFGDALFVLDPFLETNYPVLSTMDARARYLSLLSLHGYTVEALMVIDVLKDKKMMPFNEAENFETIIKKGSIRRKFKLRLGRLMLFIEKWIQLPVSVRSGLFLSKYYQGDGELGNID